jgi:hypothetical protein
MINTESTILYYMKYPNVPIYDYYIDVNGNYQYLTTGETHDWVTGETDSNGNIKTNPINDWFLPSEDELFAMYDNLQAFGVGGFTSTWYWTSSEFDNDQVSVINFTNRTQGYAFKSDTYRTRACRTFTATVGEYSLRDAGESGGLIFYIDGTTYYEAAPSDQSVGEKWSDVTTVLIGTTGTAIGTGQANTNAIVAQSVAISAADTCNDFSISTATYTSTSVELEWKDQDKLKIASKILRYLGIHLDEGEVLQYAQQLNIEP